MLKISHISKKYTHQHGTDIEVFNDFNLEIKSGEFVSIFGPNGCGKTTLLELIADLSNPDSGEITLFGKSIQKMKVGYVFQDYRNSLFHWLNAEDNIIFPLTIGSNKIINKKEAEKRMSELCSEFGCSFDLQSYPYQLSGGQQQFIALLRAIIINPDLYIFDEPFASLDYQTTLSMLENVTQIWEKQQKTTLFVSHDLDEAIFLGQKIVLLSKKPTKVVEVFDNPMSYPRTTDLLGTPEFAKLKAVILDKYLNIIN